MRRLRTMRMTAGSISRNCNKQITRAGRQKSRCTGDFCIMGMCCSHRIIFCAGISHVCIRGGQGGNRKSPCDKNAICGGKTRLPYPSSAVRRQISSPFAASSAETTSSVGTCTNTPSPPMVSPRSSSAKYRSLHTYAPAVRLKSAGSPADFIASTMRRTFRRVMCASGRFGSIFSPAYSTSALSAIAARR